MDRLDAQLLQSLLTRHEASGLFVLSAPLEPSFAERVTGDDILRIIEMLRSFCSYVVVDTPAQFNDVVLALIEHSDDVVLVAGMDIPNIKNVKLGLQTLRMLSVSGVEAASPAQPGQLQGPARGQRGGADPRPAGRSR